MAAKKLRIKLGAHEVVYQGVTRVVPTIEQVTFCSHDMAQLWGARVKLAVYLDHANGKVLAKPYIDLDEDSLTAQVLVLFDENPFEVPGQCFLNVSPFSGGAIEIKAPKVATYSTIEKILSEKDNPEIASTQDLLEKALEDLDASDEEDELEDDEEYEDEDDEDEEVAKDVAEEADELEDDEEYEDEEEEEEEVAKDDEEDELEEDEEYEDEEEEEYETVKK